MNITVYCGASLGTKEIYQKATAELGEWIAKNNNTLVYGGGKVGLMGVVADSVLENNGKVIGIMPSFLRTRELAHTGLSESIIVETMSERKLKMIELGDCYIALPGGPGTLEEISEVVSWARIGKNNNPCIFLNIGGYYDDLKKFYDNMVKNGFLTAADRNKTLFAESIGEISDFIASYTPPEVRSYK